MSKEEAAEALLTSFEDFLLDLSNRDPDDFPPGDVHRRILRIALSRHGIETETLLAICSK